MRKKDKLVGSLTTYSVRSGTSSNLKVKKEGDMLAFSTPALMSEIIGILLTLDIEVW